MTYPISIIAIHRYTLRSRVSLNAQSSRTAFNGALIRVGDNGDYGYGYGCIHPWPELGDTDLNQTLSLLAQGEYTALSRRALKCAQADAAARGEGVSLFDGLTVPRSHATLMMDEDDFLSAVEAGFSTVKVKVGKETSTEVAYIRAQANRFPELQWRLDFNGSLSLESVEGFLSDLGEEVRDKIDFIEDAYLLGTSPWVNSQGPYDIPMAVDREIEDVCGGFGSFDVAVIKPAMNEMTPILARAKDENKRVVFTSYMDHPLGQCFAAWQAATAKGTHPDVVDTCGLVTHGLFESNAFIEYLGEPAPEFHIPAGTGLGFDDLLEALPWTPLK